MSESDSEMNVPIDTGDDVLLSQAQNKDNLGDDSDEDIDNVNVDEDDTDEDGAVDDTEDDNTDGEGDIDNDGDQPDENEPDEDEPNEVPDEDPKKPTKETGPSLDKNTGIENVVFSDDEDEDEDDEDYDNEEEYYKFDEETRQTFLEDNHPEAKIHNYEEIILLSKVERNKDGIVIDDNHRTLPFLTKFERTRILGQRAKQLDDGANSFISVPQNIIDGYQIAELELEEKKIPFIIRRPLPNGKSEYWKIEDLEVY